MENKDWSVTNLDDGNQYTIGEISKKFNTVTLDSNSEFKSDSKGVFGEVDSSACILYYPAINDA